MTELFVLSISSISVELHARSVPNFVRMFLVSVAWSSCQLFTIGRIAYRRKGVRAAD